MSSVLCLALEEAACQLVEAPTRHIVERNPLSPEGLNGAEINRLLLELGCPEERLPFVCHEKSLEGQVNERWLTVRHPDSDSVQVPVRIVFWMRYAGVRLSPEALRRAAGHLRAWQNWGGLRSPSPAPSEPDGVRGGCWLWWKGKSHDIPKGVVYRLMEFMWQRQEADYDTLIGPVFDDPVDPASIRARASQVNKVWKDIGVPFRLATNSVNRYLTKKAVV